jgi:hypothetical protein
MILDPSINPTTSSMALSTASSNCKPIARLAARAVERAQPVPRGTGPWVLECLNCLGEWDGV